MKREDLAALSAAIKQMDWLREKTQEVFARVRPKWLPPADEAARWIGARLPEPARSLLRIVAGEPKVLTRGSLIKSAEEMFIRDLLSKHELIRFESTVGGPNYDGALLKRVVTFVKSGEWLESTPEWDRRRNELTLGYHLRGAVIPVVSARVAPPRTKPLKGSKAKEQLAAGYGPGRRYGEPDPRSRLGFPQQLSYLERLAEKIEQSKDSDYLDGSIQRAEELVSEAIEIWSQLQQRKDAHDEV